MSDAVCAITARKVKLQTNMNVMAKSGASAATGTRPGPTLSAIAAAAYEKPR
jgi:hypothetical protein